VAASGQRRGWSIAQIQTRKSDFDLKALIIDFIALLAVLDETVMHVTEFHQTPD
jgi:hypothetical protein